MLQIAPKVHVFGDKNTSRIRPAALDELRTHRHPDNKLPQKSTFLATKTVVNDKKPWTPGKSRQTQVCTTGICLLYTSGLSDTCAPYENHPYMEYSAMLDILNQQQELRDRIQQCLLTAGDATRNIRYCSEDSALSEKYSFVRIAALKPAQEV